MKRIEVKSIQDNIVAQVSRAILDGDIPTGTELTQMELAAELGVSRMPVREALFALEHQGLMTRLPNNHCRVVRPTRCQLARILELCRGVEADVLARMDEHELQKLPEAELSFHAVLREACGEGYPRRVLTTTVGVYVRYVAERAQDAAAERSSLLARVREHALAGEGERAQEALASYFALLLRDCPFEDEPAGGTPANDGARAGAGKGSDAAGVARKA